MKVIGIEFVCENCEVIYADLFPGHHDIHTGKCQRSYHVQDGTYFPSESTDYLRIRVEAEHFKPIITNYAGPENDGLARLKHLDCTSIVLKFDDNTEQQIYVPWKGEHFTNKVEYIREKKQNIEIVFDYHYYWNQFRYKLYVLRSQWKWKLENLSTKRHREKC